MITVIATKDHIVGIDKVVVNKGDERVVELGGSGQFFTYTNEGSFYGWCKLGRGWQVKEIEE